MLSGLSQRAALAAGALGLFLGLIAGPAAASSSATPAERPSVKSELECLALNIYHEARGETPEGKEAVGHVVLNRAASAEFPDTICGVVRQGGDKVRNRCHFSWWCDGRSDRPKNKLAWKEAQAVARKVFWGYSDDLTGGALWYHATSVKPWWQRRFAKSAEIGAHVFYRRKTDLARRLPPPERDDGEIVPASLKPGDFQVADGSKSVTLGADTLLGIGGFDTSLPPGKRLTADTQ